ncbi:PREDICTED: putative lipoyltransferase 2, mitochondrial [Papilio xuthus]|uniref:Octanoyl-[acyl-carrier-protein]:protein N-octanoyltransferase LIPT2, mitochondrial n=1 Tax=Papilio xuthus TaxID=66420 RepID=A0A194PKI5_PAPXU|nr:PREDICTED: putative lipoyltransferase 2, mitochondrial [Papilio xuthus]KPI93244.1 Putative lipoyltransferase 2, mitochondrial [Papilio xuthus]
MVKIWKLGLVSYDTALKIQQALAKRHFNALRNGQSINNDTLLLVEHKPVYTVGIRDETPEEEILRLRGLGAEFRKTNRGGLITFHGPGQLVVYPIFNLKNYKTSVKWYVKSLEETVIQLCEELGLEASRSPYTGVWIGDNKIAAIGIHASRYVTTHGISLNCDNDLSWFNHIEPCGIEDKGVTSLSQETGTTFTPDVVTPMLLNNFQKVFNCSLEDIDTDLQEDILNGVYNKLILESVES